MRSRQPRATRRRGGGDRARRAGPRPRRRPTGPAPSRRVQRLLVVAVAALGLAVLLYPMAGTWLTARNQSKALAGYQQAVRDWPPADERRALEEAQAFNRHLPAGQLRDPYSEAADDATASADYRRYLRALAVPGSQTIGQISVPKIGLDLPIFHGITQDVLSRGVGHLYGSSLPVGGAGTHAVLSAHSGLPAATMFTHLGELRTGDVFAVTVLDRTMLYRVDQEKVVLPSEVKELTIVPGQDYVTLVTCTPVNVNTHRLLVRGTRIATTDALGAGEIAGGDGPGFPWFVPIYLGGLLTAYLLAYGVPGRRSRPRSSTSDTHPACASPTDGGRASRPDVADTGRPLPGGVPERCLNPARVGRGRKESDL